MISIALNTARVIPFVKAALVKSAPYAKDLGYGVAAATALNEAVRFGIKRNSRTTRVDHIRLERFEAERPMWKKLTNTHADETWGQGVARRSNLIWDIVCFGVGDVIGCLDFFVIKIVKAALFIAGKALGYVLATIAATGISLAFAVSNMSITKLAELIQTTYAWIDKITLYPFSGVRWVDHKVYAAAWGLMQNRSWRTAAWESAAEVIDIEEHVRRGTDSMFDGTTPYEQPQPADIHHLVVLLTAEESEAKADPKAYGEKLFQEAWFKSNNDEIAISALRSNLTKDLQKLGLVAKDVALATRGFDEAHRKVTSDNATS